MPEAAGNFRRKVLERARGSGIRRRTSYHTFLNRCSLCVLSSSVYSRNVLILLSTVAENLPGMVLFNKKLHDPKHDRN